MTLHWRNSVRMDLNRLRPALNALDIPNCKVALSTITTQGARSLRAELPKDIDFILLGRSTTAYSNNVIFPLSSGVGKPLNIEAVTQSGKAVVLDAEIPLECRIGTRPGNVVVAVMRYARSLFFGGLFCVCVLILLCVREPCCPLP